MGGELDAVRGHSADEAVDVVATSISNPPGASGPKTSAVRRKKRYIFPEPSAYYAKNLGRQTSIDY